MGYPELDDYDKQMIEAFVNKPEKTLWYQNVFSRYNINGIDKISWNWSWWAFFGGMFFLLYRKAYMAAMMLFALSILSSMIPFGGFIVWILSGGYSTYFIYKVYQSKKREIEMQMEDESRRIETMQMIGGYNTWVIWVGVLFSVIWMGTIIMVATSMFMADAGTGY